MTTKLLRRLAALVGLAVVSTLAVAPDASAGAAYTFKWREHTIQIDHEPGAGGASWGWVWNGGRGDLNVQAFGRNGALTGKDILRPNHAWNKSFGSVMDTLKVCENQGNKRCRSAVHPSEFSGRAYTWRFPLYSSTRLTVQINNAPATGQPASYYVHNGSNQDMTFKIDKPNGELVSFVVPAARSFSDYLPADAEWFRACQRQGDCFESLVPVAH